MLTMVVSPLRKVAGLIGSLAATALLLALIHRSAWRNCLENSRGGSRSSILGAKDDEMGLLHTLLSFGGSPN